MESLLKNIVKIGCSFALSLTLTSCGKVEEKKEGFQYSFENQTFIQELYREVDTTGSWRSHSGYRAIRVEPNKYVNVFNYYLEYVGVYCFGESEATYRYVSQQEFQNAVNSGGSTGGGTTGGSSGGGAYNPHDPYGGPAEPEVAEEKADVMDYYLIATIKKNTVTEGCNFPIETVQYTHFRLFENGDLIAKDYNRRMEFWFKPL